jgi:hypothetical protein
MTDADEGRVFNIMTANNPFGIYEKPNWKSHSDAIKEAIHALTKVIAKANGFGIYDTDSREFLFQYIEKAMYAEPTEDNQNE